MPKNIRILLAEDHALVRAGLVMLINRQADMEVVGEAKNGEEAMTTAFEIRPDLVIMDLSMPIMNGFQATRAIKVRLPEVKILILTGHADETYMRLACEVGASGYLLKNSAGQELIRGIRRVIAGETYFNPLSSESTESQSSAPSAKSSARARRARF